MTQPRLIGIMRKRKMNGEQIEIGAQQVGGKPQIVPKKRRIKHRGEYRTAQSLQSNTDIAKQYYDSILEMTGHRNFGFKNPEIWARCAALYFISSMRRNEMFLSPLPKMKEEIKDGLTVYRISHVNEKHIVGKHIKKRDIIENLWYPENKWTRALCKFILNGSAGYNLTDNDTLNFRILLNPNNNSKRAQQLKALDKETYTSGGNKALNSIMAQFSYRYSRIFKLYLTTSEKDPTKIKPVGAVPHQARHHRAVNLYADPKGLRMPEMNLAKLIGWSNTQMVFRYVDLKNALKDKEMMAFYKQRASE